MGDTLPTTIALVNILPPEILAHIFFLCKGCHASLQNIMLVCRHWRKITVTTPRLWAHIDIGPTVPSTQTTLGLERAAKTPLCLHFFQESSVTEEDIQDRLTQFIKSLEDHIRRVYSLKIDAYDSQPVGLVLELWLDNGSPTLCHSLVVNNKYAWTPMPLRLSGGGSNSRKILGSIQILRLQKVEFPWHDITFRSLIDLRLDFGYSEQTVHPTLIHALLSANPTLVTLMLSGIRIMPTTSPVTSTPVQLEELKMLDLRGLSACDTAILLPLIAAPAATGDLCVASSFSEDVKDVFESFFDRTPIATLFLDAGHGCSRGPRSVLFASLSGTLLLRGSDLIPTPRMFTKYLPLDLLPGSSIPNVVLTLCLVTSKALIELVSRYSVKSLRLERCTTLHNSSLAAIRNSLLATYPDLECVITEETAPLHPAYNWENY